MVPLTWLTNELSRTGVGMKAGQMISTGTLTGMLAPKPGEGLRRRLRPVRLGEGHLHLTGLSAGARHS